MEAVDEFVYCLYGLCLAVLLMHMHHERALSERGGGRPLVLGRSEAQKGAILSVEGAIGAAPQAWEGPAVATAHARVATGVEVGPAPGGGPARLGATSTMERSRQSSPPHRDTVRSQMFHLLLHVPSGHKVRLPCDSQAGVPPKEDEGHTHLDVSSVGRITPANMWGCSAGMAWWSPPAIA